MRMPNPTMHGLVACAENANDAIAAGRYGTLAAEPPRSEAQ